MVEVDHVSHSQLSLWDRCPKKWEFKYVRGFREKTTDSLLIGNVYHKTLEENFKAKMELGHDLDAEICTDFFSTEWDRRVLADDEIRWVKYPKSYAKDLGISLVEKYISEVAPSVHPELVEHWFEVDLLPSKVRFDLRMDLMDVNGAVIDHKTSASSFTQADIDKDMQASATAFCIRAPIVFYNHVAVKVANPHIQVLKTVRTHDHINWWLAKANGIVAHMRSGFAPPREGGWWCSSTHCDFHEECRGELDRTTVILGGWHK